MSAENVDIVRRAIGAFNERDFDVALRDVAPDATVDMSRSRGPDAGVYVGHDAVRRFWTDITEPFDRHAMVPDEFIPHGEHVVVPMTARMTGRGGIEVEAKSAPVATLRDGRMVRWTMYQDWAEALKAVAGGVGVFANLDLVRSIFADWERGDFSRGEWADPDIEWVLVEGPSPNSWKDRAEATEGFRDWISAWDKFCVEADEYRELDHERVLVLTRVSGRGKRSGLEVGQMRGRGAELFHVRRGSAARHLLRPRPSPRRPRPGGRMNVKAPWTK